MMKRFRPGLWMTLFTLLALVLLLTLGTWQLQRLAWKTELLATLDAREAAMPVPLPVGLTAADAPDWLYRRVSLDGSVLPQTAELWGLTRAGQPGTGLMQPVQRGTEAWVLMRGWVPEGQSAALMSGTLPLVARLRPAGWQGMKLFQPRATASGLLTYVDSQQLSARWGLPLDQNYYLELESPVPAQGAAPLPLASQRAAIANNHLSYAITWYAFALILLVIYVLRARRPNEGNP